MDRLTEMEAFATVVDQGGFTDAAKKMGISKSAVSKHVSSLEARLGARLVDNGYPILPIMPGTKKPGQYTAGTWHDYPGWTKHGGRPTTEHEIAVWSG